MKKKYIYLFLTIIFGIYLLGTKFQTGFAIENLVETFKESVSESERELTDIESEWSKSASKGFALDVMRAGEPLLEATSSGNETIYCWVSINGKWTKVGTLTSDGWRDTRFYVKASRLADIYAPYGFDLEAYCSAKAGLGSLESTYVFGHENANRTSTTIWYDSLGDYYTLSDTDDTVVVPIGNVSGGEFHLYYTPGHNSLSSANWTTYQTTKTFYTVDIEDQQGLVSGELSNQIGTQYIFNGSTKEITLRYDDFNWECTDVYGTVVDGTINETERTMTYTLTGDRSYTIISKNPKLVLNIGDETVGTYYVPQKTSLWKWLQENKDLIISSDETHQNVDAYTWRVENSNVDITESTAVISGNTTIVGTKKELVTVTFVPFNSNTQDTEEIGGQFKDSSVEYTTIEIYQGNTISKEFLNKMHENIETFDTHTFIGWYYTSDSIIGELEITEDTQIVTNVTVYAKYKTKAVYTFYTNRTKDVIYQQFKDLPIGEAFARTLQDPISDEGKQFRYWINITENKVFSANDLVKGDAEFYPVFERLIFEFKENDTFLYSLYEGDQLNYDGDPQEGYYFAGFEIKAANGEPLIISNGELITGQLLMNMGILLPEVTDGKYSIQAKPVYKRQHTIIYHNGPSGQLVVTDESDDTCYTIQVNGEAVLLGPLDIMNTTSATGLALEGWADNEENSINGNVSYVPYEALDEAELDVAVSNDGVLHLWPVWGQTDTSIKVTFVSNYPSDAVDVNGYPLESTEYVLYIPKNTKPSLPKYEKIGIKEPSNTIVKDSVQQAQYIPAGWSLNPDGSGRDLQNGIGADVSKEYGVYSQGSQYDLSLTEDTTFYAIWLNRDVKDESITASFFIRLDGTLPQEPNQYVDNSAYSPSVKGHTFLQIEGALYENKNVVNDSEKVQVNIKKEPSVEKILTALYADGYSSSEHWQDMVKGYTLNTNGTYTYSGEGSTFGTLWWIEWYACKSVSCISTCHNHVDGRIRFSNEVELNYYGNGGSNVPAGTVHKINSILKPSFKNGTTKPEKDNYIFMGWSEDADALYPTYYDPDYLIDHQPQGNPMTEIQMNEDKDLYAIWEPASTMIPLDGAFSGKKILETMDDDIFLHAGDFSFQMKLIQKPDKVGEWERSTTNESDGEFNFGQFEVKYPGTYVFEIKEIIGDNTNIQYDTTIYRLTIRMVVTEAGLGIGGYSFTRNGKPVALNSSNVADSVFEFTNYYGKRDISVVKIWNDGEDADGIRPDEISVSLFRNGKLIPGEDGKQTLSTSNSWSYLWENLPTEDALGVAYEYTLKEDTSTSGYTSEVRGDMYSGFEVVNTHKVIDREVTIEKQVTGNMADETKSFDFTVTVLDEEGNQVRTLATPKDGSYSVGSDGKLSFALAHGESITIKDVPYKSTLIVNEADYTEEKYETTYSQNNRVPGTKNSYQITENTIIYVTNHKEGFIDAGIILGGIGYLIALIGAITGIVIVFLRRRRWYD